MLKRIISALLIALSLVGTIFPTVSLACGTSDTRDCSNPPPPPPPDPPKLNPDWRQM